MWGVGWVAHVRRAKGGLTQAAWSEPQSIGACKHAPMDMAFCGSCGHKKTPWPSSASASRDGFSNQSKIHTRPFALPLQPQTIPCPVAHKSKPPRRAGRSVRLTEARPQPARSELPPRSASWCGIQRGSAHRRNALSIRRHLSRARDTRLGGRSGETGTREGGGHGKSECAISPRQRERRGKARIPRAGGPTAERSWALRRRGRQDAVPEIRQAAPGSRRRLRRGGGGARAGRGDRGERRVTAGWVDRISSCCARCWTSEACATRSAASSSSRATWRASCSPASASTATCSTPRCCTWPRARDIGSRRSGCAGATTATAGSTSCRGTGPTCATCCGSVRRLMRAFVTGGAGFIGSNLVDRLLARATK